MKTKRMLILQAAILLGGMIAMQGCFEETYSTPAYYPGYSAAPVYAYPTYGYYRAPSWNHEREEHEEQAGHEYHAQPQRNDRQDYHNHD
jgi:hypothetical protein